MVQEELVNLLLVNWVVYNFYEQEEKKFEAIIQLSAKDTMLTERGIQAIGRSLYSIEKPTRLHFRDV